LLRDRTLNIGELTFTIDCWRISLHDVCPAALTLRAHSARSEPIGKRLRPIVLSTFSARRAKSFGERGTTHDSSRLTVLLALALTSRI
jgi:hypothetical protein